MEVKLEINYFKKNFLLLHSFVEQNSKVSKKKSSKTYTVGVDLEDFFRFFRLCYELELVSPL